MPVRIRTGSGTSSRPSAYAVGARVPAQQEQLLDRRVRRYASDVLKRQQAGSISPRQLADRLNDDGIKNAVGKPWAAKSVYRMLKRGKQIGLPFILRSRSEAATERVPDYTSRIGKREQSDIRFAKLFAELGSAEENDPLVIARTSEALRDEEPGRSA